jgi:putative transposase
VKFTFISRQRQAFPVQAMCQVLQVSTSGFYAWRRRGESARTHEDHALLSEIERIHAESGRRYGSPRVWQALRMAGRKHSRKRVARLTAQRGLFARRKKRFVHTTQADPAHPASDNLLQRDFHADTPNRKWVSDIKCVPTEEGDLYLAVTLDLFSRRVVGWAMEGTSGTMLPLKALHMAIEQRQPAPHALLHSDRGSQYTAAAYRQVLDEHELQQSMSRKGNVWDNAAMEAFFSTLAFECLQGRRFKTREQAKQEVFSYIETFYNRKRLHSTLGYMSPSAFEAQQQTNPTVH